MSPYRYAPGAGGDMAAMEYELMKYKLASGALGIAHWDMEVAGGDPLDPGNRLIWSPGLCHMLGLPDGGDLHGTFAGLLERIHPDDKGAAKRAFFAHLADRTGKTPYRAELRLKKENGKYLYARVFGTALRDAGGVPLRVAGGLENITEANRARETLIRSEKALDILNRAAFVLLVRDEQTFEDAMAEGLDIIAGMAGIDRMSVFRNSEGAGGLRASQIYHWVKDADGTVEADGRLADVSYAETAPRFEELLSAGECVSGLAADMPERELLGRFGCVTVLAVPVFDDGKFWGFTFFERMREESFTGQEADVLRSASFMLSSAVIRNEEARIIRRAERQTQIMLDEVPLAVTMWDKNMNIINCSRRAVQLLKFNSKQDLLDRIVGILPERQPGGRDSYGLMVEMLEEAFENGRGRGEFTQLATDGEAILFDVSLLRIQHGGELAVIAYCRDIREEKKMLAELARRDEMLEAQAHWYKSLLDGIPLPISVTDMDMNITFTNFASADMFGIGRDTMTGRHCSVWGAPMCGTDECSVARFNRGHRQTFFKRGGKSYKVDTEMLRDMSGKASGYLEIMHDVTEVESMARSHADAANEAKSVFLANISHEMRTPLNAVLGLSELLLESGGLNETASAHLDKIYSAGSTLLSIVNDILDISKIEAGKFDLLSREYDVPSLINDAVTQNILRLHSKPVRFILDIDEDTPSRLRGDELRVRQIISNLLSNAFKYTERGAVVFRVEHEREGGDVWLTFRVSDTGVGIRREHLGRLFTDYTRFEHASDSKADGTGLGLSITKKLAGLMGGTVSADSVFGEGSVFTAKIRQRYAGEGVIGPELAGHLKNFSYAVSKRRRGARIKRVAMPYARVLVVDDNLTNLDIAQGLLSPYGMDIDCVTSGQAAVDAIRGEEGRYSAVFMDHMMPGMDGVEAVRIIREEIGGEYAGNIPIIALTANAVVGSRELFIGKGFNDFISKPIDIFRLDEAVKKWVWNKDLPPELLPPGVAGFLERRSGKDRRQGAERRSDGGCAEASVWPAESASCCGLDVEKGIELFGGERHYFHVLRSFAVNTKPLLARISTVDGGSLPDYAITVHGMKSSLRGICANALGDFAESLEEEAKAGNLHAVAMSNPHFLKAARELTEDIEALLERAAKARPGPEMAGPGAEALAKLREACDEYDLNRIEDAMKEIDSYVYTNDGGLAEWLREHLTRLDYSGVSAKISELNGEKRLWETPGAEK